MASMQTAQQVATRNQLSNDDRSAFDVEFSRQKLKTWAFVALWILLGNFGAHLIYARIKDPNEEVMGGGLMLWVYLGCWARYLGGHAPSMMILTGIVLVHGGIMLASGMLRDINDRVASRVAHSV